MADDADQGGTDEHADRGPASARGPAVRLPRTRKASPWTRWALVVALVALVALLPLWIDPVILRELRGETPTPLASPTASPPESPPAVAPRSSPAGNLPPAGRLIAADSFSRATDLGWGAAEFGGSYSASATGYVADSVTGGSGQIRLGREGDGVLVLDAAAARDVDVNAVVRFSDIGLGMSSAGLVVRADQEAMYRVRLVAAPASASLIAESIAPEGTLSLLGQPVPLPFALAAGRAYVVRVQATGSDPTTIRARAWPDSDAEPADWQIDLLAWTGELQDAGAVGFGWRIEGVDGGTEILVDDLSAWAIRVAAAE